MPKSPERLRFEKAEASLTEVRARLAVAERECEGKPDLLEMHRADAQKWIDHYQIERDQAEAALKEKVEQSLSRGAEYQRKYREKQRELVGPKTPTKHGTSTVFQVHLSTTPETVKSINERCRIEGITRAELVRRAVLQYLGGKPEVRF